MLVLISILVLILLGVIIIATQFNITTVQVTGNIHYTDEEIQNIVCKDSFANNSLMLYLKNKVKPIENVPFVEKMDVEFISNHTVTITVYEKALAGCVLYMDQYMYFDKDGIVLESSTKRMEDIPCISGLKFDNMVMHEQLPIDDEKRFRLILNMTQLLRKYNMQVDGIRFTVDYEVILYYKDIKVLLGKGEKVEEKIIELNNILASIDGKKGTLHMEDYSKENNSLIFREE